MEYKMLESWEKDNCSLCGENDYNLLIKCEICDFVLCYKCVDIYNVSNELPLDIYIDLHYENCEWIKNIHIMFPNKNDNEMIGKINGTSKRDWHSYKPTCETFREFVARTTNTK